MLFPHLHALGRDAPFALIEIDLRPLRLAQFARPDEHQRRQSQRTFRREESLIRINGAQQFSDTLRFDDRGVMLFLGRGQCAAKIAGGIALRPSGRYSIAEYLSAVLHRPVGSLQCAPAFDSTQHCEQLGCFDFGDGPLAKPREDVVFEPTQNAVAVARHPSR